MISTVVALRRARRLADDANRERGAVASGLT